MGEFRFHVVLAHLPVLTGNTVAGRYEFFLLDYFDLLPLLTSHPARCEETDPRIQAQVALRSGLPQSPFCVLAEKSLHRNAF